MRPLALALAAVALSGAAPAAAGPSISLNGVAIDGVTGQRIENATVVIDAQGNIQIEAKGYAVRAVAAAQPAGAGAADAGGEAPARITRRYFLAAEHPEPGTRYDLAIFINAQWIREVKASEQQVVMEITRYLRPGPNKVVLAPTRRAQGERPSASREVALKVVIGEGNVGGDHVMIDNPLVELTRTASELEDRTEEHVLVAR